MQITPKPPQCVKMLLTLFSVSLYGATEWLHSKVKLTIVHCVNLLVSEIAKNSFYPSPIVQCEETCYVGALIYVIPTIYFPHDVTYKNIIPKLFFSCTYDGKNHFADRKKHAEGSRIICKGGEKEIKYSIIQMTGSKKSWMKFQFKKKEGFNYANDFIHVGVTSCRVNKIHNIH